jgi:hypothetical protein
MSYRVSVMRSLTTTWRFAVIVINILAYVLILIYISLGNIHQ